MKKVFSISFSIITIILFIRCNNEKINELEIYSSSAANLISDIIILENLECDCLIEPPQESIWDIKKIEQPELDLYKLKYFFMNKLNLKSQSDLEHSIFMSQNFNIKRAWPISNIKVIKQSEMNLVFKNNEYSKGQELLYAKCPKGIYSISKPIFNDKYDIALMNITLPFMHLNSGPNTYQLINGQWEAK